MIERREISDDKFELMRKACEETPQEFPLPPLPPPPLPPPPRALHRLRWPRSCLLAVKRILARALNILSIPETYLSADYADFRLRKHLDLVSVWDVFEPKFGEKKWPLST